jgi:plastocyanin domain-containing protein
LPKVQKAVIRVTANGYSPASVRLKKGIEAQVTFIRTTEQTCGTELRIPAYKIQRSLPLNESVTVKFIPSLGGVFKVTCGMNMFRGSIVVK